MIAVVGSDCFPVASCATDGLSVTTTSGTTVNGLVASGKEPIRMYFDESGYVWVTIMSYQLSPTGSILPHWVWIYRSLEPLSCDDIKAGGDAGFTPEGPGSTVWYELVCNGLAAGWDAEGTTSVCSNVSGEEPILDPNGGIITTFYRRRERCCETSTDPCNVPSEEDCEPAPDPDAACQECCDDTTAPTWVACDINTIANVPLGCDYCDLINGTWLLRRYSATCEWKTCKVLEICQGETIEFKYVTVILFMQNRDNPAASDTFPCDWSVVVLIDDEACPSYGEGTQIARFDTTPGVPGSTAPPINTPCNDWNEEPLGLTAGSSSYCTSNLGWVYITAVA